MNGTRIVKWATPQAVDAQVHGRMARGADGVPVATLTYGDALPRLPASFAHALAALGLPPAALTQGFQYAGYHWPGGPARRGRVLPGLLLADAGAAEGTTSGWTSWNARVAGAAAALRALAAPCTDRVRAYETDGCCTEGGAACAAQREAYASAGCCA